MTKYASLNKTGLLTAAVLLNALLYLIQPQEARASEFREHYEHGVKLYEAGDFESSIKEFQAAYTIKQLPKLLLNIGQAHRKLGHARDALGFYEFYLRVEPDPKPEIKVELERYIVQTKAMLAAAEKMKAQQSAVEPESAADRLADKDKDKNSPAGAASVTDKTTGSAPAEPSTAAASAVPNSDLVTPARDEKPVTKKKWFWGVIGGSAAVVTAAVVVGAVLGTRDSSTGSSLPEVRF